MSAYRCARCGKIVRRQSRKVWLKSWCVETGRTVRLMRVKP